MDVPKAALGRDEEESPQLYVEIVGDIYIYIHGYTYIPYHIIPYHTTPHHTIPYHYITLHYITLHTYTCILIHMYILLTIVGSLGLVEHG